MRRSKSSQAWLQRHFKDPYVKRAQRQGVRSRARFKLAEIDARDRLLGPGSIVVDLGAAPGGWSEYAVERIGAKGRVVAVDVLEMAPIPGVDFVHGDFTDPRVLDSIRQRLPGGADLVISDMAPNMTGVSVTDQARGMVLAELAVDFAEEVLRPGGSLLLKVFHGPGFDDLVRRLRRSFGKTATRKPDASRSESRETYLLAKGFTGREPARTYGA